ncbi:hypothetical protein MXB_1813, partial [Myxobolus squamalis]
IEVLAEKIKTGSATHKTFIPTTDESDIDKELIKNLVMAYIRVSDDQKPFAMRVICSVVGVDPKYCETKTTQKSRLAWIPIVNRFFAAETSPEDSQPSLSDLFVEYLEEESKKNLNLNPYVPPISTEELKNLVSRHNNNCKQ